MHQHRGGISKGRTLVKRHVSGPFMVQLQRVVKVILLIGPFPEFQQCVRPDSGKSPILGRY
jgi:hypothetical protein